MSPAHILLHLSFTATVRKHALPGLLSLRSAKSDRLPGPGLS